MDGIGHELREHARNDRQNSIERILNDHPQLVDSTNYYGHSALHIAAGNGRVRCGQILLNGNANINLQDNYGQTPLLHAARTQKIDMINMLLESGADHTIANDYGNTPLSWGQRRNCQRSVAALERWINEELPRRAQQQQEEEEEEDEPNEIEQLREQLNETTTQLEQALEQAQIAQTELDTVRGDLRASREQAQRESGHGLKEAAQRELDTVRGDLRASREETRRERGLKEAAQRELDTVREDFRVFRAEAERVRADLEDEVQRLSGKVDDLQKYRLRELIDRVFRMISYRRPLLDRAQLASDPTSLSRVIPAHYSTIISDGAMIVSDGVAKIPSMSLLVDIEACFREWRKLQNHIVSYGESAEKKADDLSLHETIKRRDECEMTFVRMMSEVCGMFGHDDDQGSHVHKTMTVVQRMLRMHEALLAKSDTDIMFSPPPPPSSSLEASTVGDLCVRLRSMVEGWLSGYTELCVRGQEQMLTECASLSRVLGKLSVYAGDPRIVELPCRSCGKVAEEVICDIVTLLDGHDYELNEYGRSFPYAACDRVYNSLCSSVGSRLWVLKRLHDVLSLCGNVYHVLRSRSREDFIQQLYADYDSMAKAKKTAKRAILYAKLAVEEAEDSDNEADDHEVAKLKEVLTKAKSEERRAGSEYHNAVVARLVEVQTYAPEVFVLPKYANDACMKDLREAKRSGGVVRTDLHWASFDGKPEVIASPPSSRHTVFKAVLNGVSYALKQFPMTDGNRLMKEVRIMERLNHPYITKVAFVMLEPEQRLFYQAMPFYSGGSLEGVLADLQDGNDRIDDALLKHLMRQLLVGVGHMHAKGIIHCDVKPDNVFLTVSLSNGGFATIKIGDFDISKSDDQRATFVVTMVTTDVSGYTPEYVAPELLERGSRATQKSDIYSVGLCMMDMVCGGRGNRPPPPYSVDAMRGRVTSDEEVLEVLAAMLCVLPDDRQSAPQVLALPYFAHGEVKLRQELHKKEKERLGKLLPCALCFVDVYQADGVCCPQDNDDHFLCDSCVDAKVSFDSDPHTDNDIEGRKAQIYCVGYSLKECVCHKSNNPCAYDDTILAKHVTAETFQKHLRARMELLQAAVDREAAEEVKRQVEERLEELRRLDEHSRSVAEASQHIVEEILTLKCPNPDGCGQAFVEFENCFAVQCSRCRGSFCGWCLAWCGEDAHRHVLHCSQNLVDNDVFGSVELFEESNRSRRLTQLQVYLRSLTEEVASDVVQSIEIQLRSLHLEDIIHQFHN